MADKRTILHLLYSGLGGHGSVFFSLVKADGTREWDYHAIFSGIEPMRPEYEEKCRRFDVPFEFVQKKPGMDIGVYWKIAQLIRRHKPTVLLLHGSSFILPAMLSKIWQPSLKIIIRDTQAHHLKTKRDWTWLKWAIRIANRVIVLTPEAGEGIRKHFGDKAVANKMVVISNGIDTEIYKSVRQADRPVHVIGMQSRLQKIKDHPTLFRAFKLLREQLPGQEFKLKIAGDGETMQQLQSLAKELSLQDAIEFCGMLNEQELVAFMHSLDLYVHATAGETMSNSIMQALACGLPVIASDVWGVNNMITHGQNGLLYEPGNAKDLSSKMAEVIHDNEKRKNLAIAAREFAEANYSNHLMFKRYKELYN